MDGLIIDFIESKISKEEPFIHINELYTYFNIPEDADITEPNIAGVSLCILNLIKDGTIAIRVDVDVNGKESLYISLKSLFDREINNNINEGLQELEDKIEELVRNEEYEKAAEYQKIYDEFYKDI